MKYSRHLRLAFVLLERVLPDGAPLAGDLIEEFERRQSRLWLWWQVLAAIATACRRRPSDIRPLRLVDLQPTEAAERSRRMNLRVRRINLSASPLPGVGGLGLVALAFLVTAVLPGVWWALLASAIAGASIGLVVLARRRAASPPVPTIRPQLAPR